MRNKVVATVEEEWKAVELQELLPPGEARMAGVHTEDGTREKDGGPLEGEAWAMGGGYRVKVYRETKDGAGHRKIQKYGEEKGVSLRVGILSKKTRVYEVVWGQEREVKRSTAREGDGEGICRGAPARASVGSGRGHSVTSSDSRPSTCGAGSVGSTEGNEMEQQRKAAGHGRGEKKNYRGREKGRATGC